MLLFGMSVVRKIFPVLLGALFTVSILPAAEKGYVFSYFIGNGEDGLHLCTSRDGLAWKPVASGKSLLAPAIGEHKLMRDPSILRGPDGLFRMVWTISWTQRGIGYAHSNDLVHWSPQRAIPVMAGEPTTRNAWAPELFYDESGRDYYIIWASTIPEKFQPSTSEDGYEHRQYYKTTKDFETFSADRLYFDPGHSVIDAFLARDGTDYLLFYKDETLRPVARKTIHLARGKTPTGPFTPGAEIAHQNWVEGAAALKIGPYWYVYYDCYRDRHYGAVRSKDLQTWENVTEKLHMPRGMRHGTALEVEAAILDGLEQLP